MSGLKALIGYGIIAFGLIGIGIIICNALTVGIDTMAVLGIINCFGAIMFAGVPLASNLKPAKPQHSNQNHFVDDAIMGSDLIRYRWRAK